MKRAVAFILLICFLSLAPGAVWADFKRTKIAVLDFELKGRGFETEDMGAIVAEWFITAFVKEGRFDVIERTLLNKILGEQKLHMSGIIDETTATKIGKLLGVKIIISGSVLKLQDILEINARIIDVETASIIAAENVKSSAAVRLQDLVVQMAVKIIKNFPLEGYIVSRTKGQNMVSIDLGRLAGVKKDMEFEVFKEGKVIKHPKTGEVLDVEHIFTGRIAIASVRENISKAKIVSENPAGAIRFGQRVKSLGALTPVQPEYTLDNAVEKAIADSSRKRARRPTTVNEAIALMKSADPRKKVLGAKSSAKQFPKDPAVLKAAEEELLLGYDKKTKDRYYIDALAWFCNILGRSGAKQYRDTLKMVSMDAKNRKVKKYAKKNYSLLK